MPRSQEITTKLEARKEERRKRANAEYAARATRRVEDWMVSAADDPKVPHLTRPTSALAHKLCREMHC